MGCICIKGQKEMLVYALPADMRKALSDYIQANPSPNVAVGSCIQLVMGLQNLKPIPSTPALVEDGESYAEPGGEKEESGD